MCGLTGFWNVAGTGFPEAIQRMSAALVHRGPDADGHWTDPSAGIALGFRRLSILDLSDSGSQPMASRSGRLVMVFNGEVYNHRELREALGGPWRGHSDTEVVLEAIERWGLRKAVLAFNGMFALAVWDRAQRRLSLARDRFGKKPLYVGTFGRSVVFGSELKALRAHPGFEPDLDREAMASFLRFGYVPGPASLYRKVRKLEPGSLQEWQEDGSTAGPERYWHPVPAAVEAQGSPFAGPFEAAVEVLEGLLRDAVRIRSVADVPVGAFLSGGIDSSLVVAAMQAAGGGDVRSFTIGFRDQGLDEAPFARRVAQHLGTRHTEQYLDGQDALAVVPRLPNLFDEPFADPSQIPTFLLSRMTREHVTVALSGDGGDELFCGYDRYVHGLAIQDRIRRWPAWVRRAAAGMAAAVPAQAWDRSAGALLGPRWRSARIHKAARLIREQDPQAFYLALMSAWTDPGSLVEGAGEALGEPWAGASLPARAGFLERAMLTDACTYLVDDILVKVDRASMACSLEVRNPLLDPRIFAFAWSLPLSYRISGRAGKRILRALLHRQVPAPLVDRPKMGFGIPLGPWLRGALRPWAEDLLGRDSLVRHGLQPGPALHLWRGFLHDGGGGEDRLWPLLVLLQWLESQRKP